jgi:hypothetical protein
MVTCVLLSGKLYICLKILNKGKIIMKKFLALTLLLGTSIMFVPSAEAKNINGFATANSVEPQIKIKIGGNQRNRRVRTVTRTRIVRQGRRSYRETYRITYLANGRTRTQVVSRVIIR